MNYCFNGWELMAGFSFALIGLIHMINYFYRTGARLARKIGSRFFISTPDVLMVERGSYDHKGNN